MSLPKHRYLSGLSALVVALFVAVMASAIKVAYSANTSRQLLNTLFVEIKQRDKLQAEWGRLVLENSTWTAHHRIERLAITDLRMHVPEPATVRVVAP